MFTRSQQTISAYAGIELELPNGERVVGKVLPLKRAIHYLGLMDRAQRGDPKATAEMVDRFPEEVGLRDELNRLTLEEFWETASRFFTRRHPRAPVASNGTGPDLTTP